LPVLLSVPHSGRDYPPWLVDMSAGGEEPLRALEDPLVDLLAERAIADGIGAVIARAPRAAIDCNRAEDDVDPSVVEGCRRRRVSARARGGLGIVPARTQAHGYLWRRPVSMSQLDRRIEEAHRPFHDAIADGLDQLSRRFGCALLLDCHSMPPSGPSTIVIGDRFGRSAAPWLSSEAARICRTAGYSVGLNVPFAGGHVVERHGIPLHGIHALQIEIDRTAYLDASLRRPGPGFARAADLLHRLAHRLGEALLGGQFATAAE
jgi:N-formylglutamate amidohydrolase